MPLRKNSGSSCYFGKQERQDAFDTAEAEMVEMFSKQEDTDLSPWEEKERYYKMAFDELIRRYVRDSILRKQHRVDGRGTDDIREITCEIDILPGAWIGTFYQGETQSQNFNFRRWN